MTIDALFDRAATAARRFLVGDYEPGTSALFLQVSSQGWGVRPIQLNEPVQEPHAVTVLGYIPGGLYKVQIETHGARCYGTPHEYGDTAWVLGVDLQPLRQTISEK